VLVEHPDTPVTRKVIDALDDCWLIAKYSIGLDNIAVKACTERGIIVCHAPNFCVSEVSDHAVALLLNLARRIKVFDERVQHGGWHDLELKTPLRRLKTQTLGLLGFGKIARLVASKMKPFEVRMLCFDPYVTAQTASDCGVEIVDLGTLLQESDFLSIHAPLTSETYHLIGAPQLKLMKATAWIVNTSRGPLIDEAALAVALLNETIAGAALDVTETEPLSASSALRGLKNVILTAHHAAVSQESLEELRETLAKSIEAVCRGHWPNFVANPSVAPRRHFRPWSEFARLPSQQV
jgi:D-3-phosphoglycerate dehydrogenase / 2-oxoglutarate reductase